MEYSGPRWKTAPPDGVQQFESGLAGNTNRPQERENTAPARTLAIQLQKGRIRKRFLLLVKSLTAIVIKEQTDLK